MSEIFTVKINDKDIELRIIKPSGDILQRAQREFAKVWGEAVRDGAMLKAKLNDFMESQGLWDEIRQAKYLELIKTINEGQKVLEKIGGIKLSEARKIALNMMDARNELHELIAQRTVMESNTAEGLAENARFNYILVNTLVYNKEDAEPYFKDINDYLEHADDEVAQIGARHLADTYFGYDNALEEKLPENKFLKQFKFINDQGKLIDKDGNLINRFGNKVTEDGKLVQEEVKPEDAFKPFEDDR